MSKHVKRLAQPRRWKIPRKEHTWGPKVRPGPHAEEDAIPIVVAVRDLLGLADTAAEAKQAIKQGSIHVNGSPVRDERHGLGFMDVVTIPDGDLAYRTLYDPRGRIALLEVAQDDAGFKLSRIEDKVTINAQRTQLNLHDGRNVLVKEDMYDTGDVLRLKVPDQTIADHYPFEEGASVVVTGGAHVGEFATVKEKKTVRSSAPNLVLLESDAGTFETIQGYAFVIGGDEPALDIPGVSLDG